MHKDRNKKDSSIGKSKDVQEGGCKTEEEGTDNNKSQDNKMENQNKNST